MIGTHFWNPPHLVPLVEVTQNEKTSAETVRKTMELLRDAGRAPVHIKRDIPGFVGNRLQHAIKREAIALVAAGVCDADTIDEVVKTGFGARMAVLGPMEQSDLVGTDLTLDIQNVLLSDLNRDTEPTQYLKDLVASGRLGMRTGEGLRKWTPEAAEAVRARLRQLAGGAGEGEEAVATPYCGVMPAAFTVLATRSLSALSIARDTARSAPRHAGSMPAAAKCLMISGSLTIAATSAAILSTSPTGGVPARA